MGLVREQTGTRGLLVGLALALLPVPLLIAAFRWLGRTEPTPWQSQGFAFAWGACAATLVALLANGFASDWLISSVEVDSADHADRLTTTVVAPVVEEITKGVAVLLLFLFRREQFTGVVPGIVFAGSTAAGFAFTENVLYLGSAYDADSVAGAAAAPSETVATFLVRIVFSPFAHPLFTAFIGIALGILAALPRLGRLARTVIPLLGLVTAVLLHAIWNGAASFADLTFLAVYGLFMLPVFAALTALALWARFDTLRSVRAVLPSYVAAGWFTAAEPAALGSMRARALARGLARQHHGSAGARAVEHYQRDATRLAQLRASAEAHRPGPDFGHHEQMFLHRLWELRPLAGPATERSVATLPGPRAPLPVPAPAWRSPYSPYSGYTGHSGYSGHAPHPAHPGHLAHPTLPTHSGHSGHPWSTPLPRPTSDPWPPHGHPYAPHPPAAPPPHPEAATAPAPDTPASPDGESGKAPDGDGTPDTEVPDGEPPITEPRRDDAPNPETPDGAGPDPDSDAPDPGGAGAVG
ncbi:PrsW family intramembrane metalloprotease [Streptomyces sp. AJS327]|nr:PrsW family intramembrane metalloprotease [Streptomyces sp. AJS327]